MNSGKPRYWAIVPAAGAGKRMGTETPKQYLFLNDKRVIEHTLARLSQISAIAGIVVCVAAADKQWQTLEVPAQIWFTEGGAERCHSVLNGLRFLGQWAKSEDWVLTHDAARPCVRSADIEKLINTVADHAVGGLLGLPVRDTMKRADARNQVTQTVNRAGLWHALTPQMFRWEALKTALEQRINHSEVVTDESEAMEKQGAQPLMVEGSADNLKMTHPSDLLLAELFLRHQEKIGI